MSSGLTHPEIVVDLTAIKHNLRLIQQEVSPAAVMFVVKADGYGHGMIASAAAARQVGVSWIGVATVVEALALRAAGDQGRIAAWLDWPETDYESAVDAGIDLTAYTSVELDRIAAAACTIGGKARVQLKVDTGLGRGGSRPETWPDLIAQAVALHASGAITVTGIWSHFVASDEPDNPINDQQQDLFEQALATALAQGLTPEVTHLANSAAALLRPQSRYNLVRVGIAGYGLEPAPAHPCGLDLIPAMSVRAPLAMCKEVRAGEGVSYGHMWVAPNDTTLGLVPIGYGDGLPRQASNRAQVAIAGQRAELRGRICMDQFIVDLGGQHLDSGTPVTIFGPGDDGEPSATDWAVAAGTINYEIVTRMGGRLQRRWHDDVQES